MAVLCRVACQVCDFWAQTNCCQSPSIALAEVWDSFRDNEAMICFDASHRSPEYIIYVKEFPFLFVEKLISPEAGKMNEYIDSRASQRTGLANSICEAASDEWQRARWWHSFAALAWGGF